MTENGPVDPLALIDGVRATPDPRSLIDIAVRPEADAFPMLDPDAFADLAAGIYEHGQLEAIELDAEGAIGDGRNRYAACRWLGTEPRTVTLPPDTDWFARIVEKNLNRRHATVGGRAIALVKMLCSQGTREIPRGGIAGLSHPTLGRARFLIEHADDLVPQVEAGASLRAAYDLAVERERERADADLSAVDDEARRIARLEELERERARLVESVRARLADIGPPIALPPEPALEIRFEEASEVEEVVVPKSELDIAALRAQERLHAQLQKIKIDLVAIRDVGIGPGAPMYEGLVLAFRSWATQVVALTYEIVERHNAALEDQRLLRRVK